VRVFAAARGASVADALICALRTEKDGGFPTIGRLPSTEAKRFMRYVDPLAAERWQVLSATLGKRGSSLLVRRDAAFPYVQVRAALSGAERQELESWHRAAVSAGGDLELMPLRLMRMAAGADKNARTPAQFGHWPEEIRRIEEMRTAKAATLRKLLKVELGGLGFTGTNTGGGGWAWSRTGDARACKVALDFGSRTDQMRYHVHLAPKGGPGLAFLSLEGLLGFGHGHWNTIVESEAGAAAHLLAEIVEDICRVPETFRGTADFRLER
jgi:hypothetical protein